MNAIVGTVFLLIMNPPDEPIIIKRKTVTTIVLLSNLRGIRVYFSRVYLNQYTIISWVTISKYSNIMEYLNLGTNDLYLSFEIFNWSHAISKSLKYSMTRNTNVKNSGATHCNNCHCYKTYTIVFVQFIFFRHKKFKLHIRSLIIIIRF